MRRKASEDGVEGRDGMGARGSGKGGKEDRKDGWGKVARAEVVLMEVSKLLPARYNPRTIGEDAKAGLRRSLERFGLVEPVVWNRRSGRLVGGHQRVEELRGMGVRKASVSVVDLGEADETALNVALNNPKMQGEFDASLSGLLEGLKDDVDFSSFKFDDLMVDLSDSLSLGDRAVETSSTIEFDSDDYPKFEMKELDVPFPWFGGKKRVAHIVWHRFGDVKNYVEPFFGGGSVLLGRPTMEPGVETVNDLDGFVANFWRSVKLQPKKTAEWADNPVNENDLHARHVWLRERRSELSRKLEADPDYCDPKIAGWWVWGICCWIGSGWCNQKGNGSWVVKEVNGVRQLVHLGGGQGVSRQRVDLGGGRGVNRPRVDLVEWFEELAERFRNVRVCSGDWIRVCGSIPTYLNGMTGVFLDPPYDMDERDVGCYSVDERGISAKVREWAIENGNNPLLRIALCGYEGEHKLPGWDCVSWKTVGGYGVQARGDTRGKENVFRERIWFSPHCLPWGKELKTNGKDQGK